MTVMNNLKLEVVAMVRVCAGVDVHSATSFGLSSNGQYEAVDRMSSAVERKNVYKTNSLFSTPFSVSLSVSLAVSFFLSFSPDSEPGSLLLMLPTLFSNPP